MTVSPRGGQSHYFSAAASQAIDSCSAAILSPSFPS
jgi:hypothetical protein